MSCAPTYRHSGVRLGLLLITKITEGYWLTPTMISSFPTFPHKPLPCLPHCHPIATSLSHCIAPCPSPFHCQPCPSTILLPITLITLCSSLKALCLVVPLSNALFLALDSHFALIRSVLYYFTMIILLYPQD